MERVNVQCVIRIQQWNEDKQALVFLFMDGNGLIDSQPKSTS
jgi:hypothetical protein